QKQHVEIARDTAGKFNRAFGETFKLPEHLIMKDVETVPGIDGRKMSKSYGNTIPLFAEDDETRKIVMSIVTDSKGADEPKDPSKCNIFSLHKLFSKPTELSKIKKRYETGDISYKESKELLAENIISFLRPMRERRKALGKDRENVLKILKNGGEMARENALLKMREVRERVGLII
ncbi:MAG: tryptophan--tRNA ligase, partial [Patescibacteria group bacterium]